MNTLEGIIGTKVDRDDLKEIHAYIDQRFKTFKPKVQQKQRAEETAAGTKKQLIKNCNCISCDRPVEMTTGGDESERIFRKFNFHSYKRLALPLESGIIF